MASKDRSDSMKKPNADELRWVLEGFTPDTLPMARLAEYMEQLAKLYGHDEAVHFERLEDNCVAVISRVDLGPERAKVGSRVRAVGSKSAAPDAMRAFENINRMLGEDEKTARLKLGSAIIIRFPGIVPDEPKELTIEDAATISGYLYYLSEDDEGKVHLRIRPSSGNVVMCQAKDGVGKNLRAYLFSDVRVSGKGTWVRSFNGDWNLKNLEVSEASILDQTDLKKL